MYGWSTLTIPFILLEESALHILSYTNCDMGKREEHILYILYTFTA